MPQNWIKKMIVKAKNDKFIVGMYVYYIGAPISFDIKYISLKLELYELR